MKIQHQNLNVLPAFRSAAGLFPPPRYTTGDKQIETFIQVSVVILERRKHNFHHFV
jgi:hypothetical protein